LKVGAYRINIVGLGNKEHVFHYELGSEFFREYGSDLVSEGTFAVDLVLDKRETFLEADFRIRGVASLICDRSLESFDFSLSSNRKIVFKYGDTQEEITDEITIIPRDTTTLELGQYIYEFIVLAIPLKKLHPRYLGEEDDDDASGKIVYSSEDADTKKESN
jgi:uncharacterized metal-binding protein YceD (DUF177 family)